MAASDIQNAKERAEAFRKDYQALADEIGKVIVGHGEVVHGVLTALFASGHALLEGVPGLGKTLLVRTLGHTLQLPFCRIQFTPDLMPADILGTDIVSQTPEGERVFRFRKGPIFSNLILADEINRATPKTQSALLEAMQERSVTVGGRTEKLVEPFLVMATQNPIDMEGTYPLPEAQMDRFLFKIQVRFSSVEELRVILDRTTDAGIPEARPVVDAPKILEHRKLVREVVAAPHVKDYAARLVWATHPESDLAPERVKRFVRFGASPRGAQALILAGKVRALVDGRYNVSFEDVQTFLLSALRHRIILNFEGEAEGVKAEDLLKEIRESVPTKVTEPAAGGR